MKDVDKKNIIFLSDENTPYVKEFTLLSDEEIADLVERRLFSNNYFNYTIYSIHKSKGIITLIRDACGHKLETTLSKIEDGLIPEKCTECRQAEKDKLLAFKDEIQDELKERGLVVVLFETEDNTDSLYIECTKCGAKYYLNEDFELDNEAWEMYCKNWDCMMDALALEGHWFVEGVSNGNIVIKENTYKPSRYSFVQDYEDWYESLTASDGYYESKCEQCNVINIRPLGRCKCEICFNWGGCVHWDGWCESGLVKVWDEIEDQVTIQCKKCGNRYQVSRNDAKKGAFGCFECYKRDIANDNTCPVCDTEHTERVYFCNTCGFPIGEFRKEHIMTQSQYTAWLKNTVKPCWRVWNDNNPKYIKALNDLRESLKNERILNEKLSQCYTEITEYCKKITALNEEIRGLKEKTAVVGILESYFEQKSKGEVVHECSGESKIDKVLSITLEEMNFSVRTYNCLKRAGINVIEQLMEMSYNEVLAIKNLGKKSFEEVINRLAMLGLYLKE